MGHVEEFTAVLAVHGVGVVLNETALLAAPLHFRRTKNLSDQTHEQGHAEDHDQNQHDAPHAPCKVMSPKPVVVNVPMVK